MRKQKKGRRFVQRVHVKKMWGKEVAIPKELQTEIHVREPGHVAVLTCPLCGAVRYMTQAQLDFVAGLKQAVETESMKGERFAAVAHKPCKAIMKLEMLKERENPMETLPTTEKLAQALLQAGAPEVMIGHAKSGYYDDFKSPIATPIKALVDDARKYGLSDIAQRAMDREFDSTKEESDAWARSPEGQEIFRQLLKGKEKS